MSNNTRNKALRIMGCDTGRGGGHCAHGFRATASTLLNEEGAFGGDVVEAQLAHGREKKAPAARRGGAAPPQQGRQKQHPRRL
jgi:integrase